MPENETTTDPVTAALERYGDQLVPGAVEQLSVLFDDLRTMPPGVAANLVQLRLADSSYAHFRLSPSIASGTPTVDEQLRQRVQSGLGSNLLAGRHVRTDAR